MNYLGIDYGSKSIGLSYGSGELKLAVPLTAVGPQDIVAALEKHIKEKQIDEIIVGYPIQMDGNKGSRAKEVEDFINSFKHKINLPIRLSDERLSTFQAKKTSKKISLKQKLSKNKKQKKHKANIDSMAATVILQDYLDQL